MLSDRTRRLDLVAFGVLFVVVLVLRGGAAHVATNIGIDGGYYFGVAQQVRLGRGLVSNLSIYNFGYPEFPYPTGVYPLWPLLLGHIGRFVDMEEAAHWVPWGLYMVSGIAAYGFGRAAFPGPLVPRVPWLGAGHLFAALLWTNPQYRGWSVGPYTEPLAWTFLFFALWRLAVNRERLTVAWGLELGVWALLPYFTRAQFLVFPLAIAAGVALRVAVGPDRGRVLRFGLAALAPIALGMGAWWARVASFTAHDGPGLLLRFDTCRVNDLLPELVVMYPVSGPLHWVVDRIIGIGVAWSPTGSSYWESFYVMHWVAPVAVVAGGLWAVAHRAELPARALARLRAPDGLAVAIVALFALGAWVSVQIIHKQFSSPWYFDQREGLVAWFFFVLPTVWLLRRGGWTRVLASLALLVSLGYGARAVWREARFTEGPTPLDQHARLAKVLAKWDAERPGPMIVALEEGHAQRTAWRTPDIGYHWLGTRTPYAGVDTMVHELGAGYVIWDNPRDSWPFLRAGGRLEAEYAQLEGLPSPFKGVTPREVPLPAAPPRRVVLVAVDGAGKTGLARQAGRFLVDGYASGSWARVAAGGDAGPPIWEVAQAAGRSVGVYGWPGAGAVPATTVDDAVAAWATTPHDLTVIGLRKGDSAGLSRLLEVVSADTMLVVAESGDSADARNIWVRGPDVKPGRRPRRATPDDVAPTVAWLLGLPIAADRPGRVLSEALAWDAAGALGRTDTEHW